MVAISTGEKVKMLDFSVDPWQTSASFDDMNIHSLYFAPDYLFYYRKSFI